MSEVKEPEDEGVYIFRNPPPSPSPDPDGAMVEPPHQVEAGDYMTVFGEVTSLLSYAVGRLAAMAGSVDDNPALLLAVDAVTAHSSLSLASGLG